MPQRGSLGVMRSAGPRGRMRAALFVGAVLVASCSTPSPRSSGTPGPSRTAPASVSGKPSSSPAGSELPRQPDPDAVHLEPLATGLDAPIGITNAGDGSGRLFVNEQGGVIRVIDRDGSLRPQPFVDLSSRIASGGERGLLGLAVHPGFAADPRIFVDYTDLNGDTVVSSFALITDGSGRFDPASEHVVLQVKQPFPNHNGGGVLFGPDGDLYIALGDGGSGGDPMGNGQRLDTLLAKVLRIDVDHPAGGKAYGIPADNPFASRSGARGEIWLYGLRNPFRIEFDRSTGDMWIGDVGQNKWEEVDVVRAGAGGGQNFGWNVMEGAHCYLPADGCKQAGLTLPVTEYGHDQGCAVIGGFVYRGSSYPALRGGYLFTDECSGTIWAIPAATSGAVAPVAVGEATGAPAGFGEDAAGELYLANLDGSISKIIATSR